MSTVSSLAVGTSEIAVGVGAVSTEFYLLHKYGFRGLCLRAERALKWFITGAKQEPIRPDCLMLHKTAAMELALYEAVMSYSIQEHIDSCKKYDIVRKDDTYDVRDRVRPKPRPPKGPGAVSPVRVGGVVCKSHQWVIQGSDMVCSYCHVSAARPN